MGRGPKVGRQVVTADGTRDHSRIADDVAGRDAVIGWIRRLFAQSADVGQPKHLQLRKAILASIRDDILKRGDQVPPEQDLAAALRLSLGTVRRALGQLALDGTISRDHGRGTFVTKAPRTISDAWHFRFYADDGRSFLPVYSHVLGRDVVDGEGPWSTFLGADPEGYVHFARCFNVDSRFLCYSEFYLRANRFRKMLDLPLSDLDSVNLKRILSEQFGTPTLYVSQRVRTQPLPRRICDIISVKRSSWGLFLEIVGYSFQNVPISYHAIWSPATKHLLDLTLHGIESPVASTEG